jgi:hypothetical protein
MLPGEEVWAQAIVVTRLTVFNFEQKRRAAMPVPKLGGIDAMPMRDLASLQQKRMAVEWARPL